MLWYMYVPSPRFKRTDITNFHIRLDQRVCLDRGIGFQINTSSRKEPPFINQQ